MDKTLSEGGSFSAHYKIKDGRLINFGGSISGIMDMKIKIHEYAPESFDVVHYSEVIVPKAAFSFIHDFVVSDNYYCFYLNACDLDLKKFALEYVPGKTSIAQCIQMKEGKEGRWLLIPRNGKTEDKIILDVPGVD